MMRSPFIGPDSLQDPHQLGLGLLALLAMGATEQAKARTAELRQRLQRGQPLGAQARDALLRQLASARREARRVLKLFESSFLQINNGRAAKDRAGGAPGALPGRAARGHDLLQHRRGAADLVAPGVDRRSRRPPLRAGAGSRRGGAGLRGAGVGQDRVQHPDRRGQLRSRRAAVLRRSFLPTSYVFFHLEENDRLPQLLDGLRPNPNPRDLELLMARLGVGGRRRCCGCGWWCRTSC